MYFTDLIQGQMKTKPGGSRTCAEASRMQGEKTCKKAVVWSSQQEGVTALKLSGNRNARDRRTLYEVCKG